MDFYISLTYKLIKQMNTFSRLLLLTLFGLTFGCKSMTESMFNHNNIQRVEIGSVGLEDVSLFKNTFNSVGFIKLSGPIKLEVTSVSFTNKSYKDFVAAKASQSSNLNIVYKDSLKQKPTYLNIRITDILKLIEQLHEPDNISVKNYLETNGRAGVVMELSIAFSDKLMNEILDATAIFLTQSSETTYQLQLINESGEIKQIFFKNGVTMDYELSKPCWKSSGQNKYKIVELLGSGDKCSSGAYRSPRFIKIKEDYFKL